MMKCPECGCERLSYTPSATKRICHDCGHKWLPIEDIVHDTNPNCLVTQKYIQDCQVRIKSITKKVHDFTRELIAMEENLERMRR